VNIIIFIFLNILLYLLGRSFVLLFIKLSRSNKKINDIKVFNTSLDVFFPVISLFFLGNIVLLSNFIFSFNEIRDLFTIFLFTLLAINLLEKPKIKFDLYFVFSFFIIPFVFSLSAYDVWFHFDAKDYHLNAQNYINESKVIIGLSNLYLGYGWSTIHEYISVNFWSGENFIGLHFLNLVYFVTVFNFFTFHLYYKRNVIFKNTGLFFLIYGFLDNFGFGGGNNGFIQIQSVGKPDVAFGILFFLINLMMLAKILENKFEFNDLIFISYSIFFAFQIRISGIYLSPLFFYFLYRCIKTNEISLYIYFKKIKVLFFLLVAWVIKNLLITSCLVFPISFTCFNTFSWSLKKTDLENYYYILSVVQNQRIIFSSGEEFFNWANHWFNHAYNSTIILNFIISFFVILIINKFISKNESKSFKNNLKLSLYFLFLIGVWFITAPVVRYGFGIFLVITSSIYLFNYPKEDKYKFLSSNLLIFSLLFLTVFSVPRFYQLTSFIKDPLSITELNIENYDFRKIDNSFTFSPTNKDNFCWIKQYCIRGNKKHSLNLSNGYTFISENNN